MKKGFLILGLAFLLVGCGTQTTTVPSVSTTTTTIDTETHLLATPSGFWSDPGTFQWEPIAGAEEYSVRVGETILTTSDAWIWLGEIPANAFYSVQVKAVGAGTDSAWSAPEEYAKFDSWGSGYEVVHSVLSESDFSFVIGADLEILDVRYAEEDAGSGKTNESIVKTIEENAFSLGKSYVTEGPEGILEYVVYTTAGSFPLSLSRTEEEGPYVVNPGTFHLHGDIPAVFVFDLMGWGFSSLSGNGITAEGYVYENGVLTVSRSFLDPLFTASPDRNVILTYTVSNGTDTEFGFLVIDHPGL